MRIAIASSGLGHVARGIETWARDTAVALAEQGADVTLFTGAELVPAAGEASLQKMCTGCLRRNERMAQGLAKIMPGFLWRVGLKHPYGWEQLSFWLRLWPRLRKGRFDVLHVQDPMVADWCRRFRNRGLVGTKEILAHGTEEPIAFLEKFDYVQHLAPWHMEKAEGRTRNAEVGKHKRWAAIPNFVDTGRFRPARDEAEKKACREAFGIPADAFVVGCVAALKKSHKRIDYLIREFATLSHSHTPTLPHFLVIAGARQADTDELIALAEELVPGRARIFPDLPRKRMPALYRAFDMFVLTSLFEMMPIAVLEALASGLAVIANRHPVLEWMTGCRNEAEGEPSYAGGACVKMDQEGTLARFLVEQDRNRLRETGLAARRCAEQVFSKQAIVSQYIQFYQSVCKEI